MSKISQYRIGVLEDDTMIAETLVDILETLNHQVVFVEDNGKAFIEQALAHEAELLLMDIQVKGDIDGVETAAILNKEMQIPYIFTTAFADDATLSRVKETAPYGYLVKPYGIKEIQAAVQVAMIQFSKHKKEQGMFSKPTNTEDHLFVKVNGRLQRVLFSELLYAEAKGDYVLLKTKSQGLVVHQTMKNLLQKLPQPNFFQVHRSFIINVKQIDTIEDNSVTIENKHIPVSKAKTPTLLDILNLL